MGGNRLSWPSTQSAFIQSNSERRLFRVSGTNLPGKAARPRNRNRRPRRREIEDSGQIDRADQAYWKDVIKPMIDSSPNVEFVGEIGERDKGEFLGNADALLFPIDWPDRSDLS